MSLTVLPMDLAMVGTRSTASPFSSEVRDAVERVPTRFRGARHEFIRGILTLLLAVSSLSAATHYVSLGSTNPTPPYTNWATAATSIQAAVNAAATKDAVLVTNGVYPGYVSVTSALTLLSVNGPQFTIINGGGTSRCIDLTDGASLTGFTLTNGYTTQYDIGGGVECASTKALLSNCLIVGNSAYAGGGASGGTLYNCTLNGNLSLYGGGASSCTLYNCTVSGNSASGYGGGGAYGCALYNCTLSGNSASYGSGGGANRCALYNCIVYYNTALGGANYDSSSTLNYCCTTPLPTAGAGNLALDPQLASASHLSAGSPCRGAGSAAYASGTDIDGEPWGNPPAIGCDEYHAGAITGPLTVGLVASDTNVMVDYAVSLTALIEGRTTQSVWDFGDGVVVSNRPYASHAWAAPGDYAVAVRAYNESNVAGVSATLAIHVVPPACALCRRDQPQSSAALRLVGHGRQEHSRCRECGWIRACGSAGDQRRISGQRLSDQAANAAERQWPTVHDHQWRRHKLVRFPDQ